MSTPATLSERHSHNSTPPRVSGMPNGSATSSKEQDRDKRRPGVSVNNMQDAFASSPASKGKGKGKENAGPSNVTQKSIEHACHEDEDDSDDVAKGDDFKYEASTWVGGVPRERLGRGGSWTPVDGETFWNHSQVVGRSEAAKSFGIPQQGTMPGYGPSVPFWAQTCRAQPPLNDTEWKETKTRMRALMGAADPPSTSSATSSTAASQFRSSGLPVPEGKGKASGKTPSASTSSSSVRSDRQDPVVTPPTSREALRSQPIAGGTLNSSPVTHPVEASVASNQDSVNPPSATSTPSASPSITSQHPAASSPSPASAGMISTTPDSHMTQPSHHAPSPSASAADMHLARSKADTAIEGIMPVTAPQQSTVPAAPSTKQLAPAPDLAVSSSNDSISSLPMVKTPHNLSLEDIPQASIAVVDKCDGEKSTTDPLGGDIGEHAFRTSLANLMSRRSDTASPIARPIPQRAKGAFLIPKRSLDDDRPLARSSSHDPVSAPTVTKVTEPQPPTQLEQSSSNDVILMAKPSRIRLRPRQRTGERPVRPLLGPAPDVKLIGDVPSDHRAVDHVGSSIMDRLPLPLSRIPESPEQEQEEQDQSGHGAESNHDYDDPSLITRPSNIPGHRPLTPLEAGLHDDNPFYVRDRSAGPSRPHRLAPRGSDESLMARFERQALEGSPNRTRSASWHASTSDIGTPPPSPVSSRFSTPLALITEDEEGGEEEEMSSPASNSDDDCHPPPPVSSLLSRFSVPMADIPEEEEEEED